MGIGIEKKFERRFGGRISVVFADKPLSPTEQKLQNDALVKAIREVMTGILGREPTEGEMRGRDDVSIYKEKENNRFLR
jgi:hypothetical protein